MTFKDIFKKSFIEGWSGSEIDALSAASVMAITLLLALFIFLIYKITTKKQAKKELNLLFDKSPV